MGVFSVKTEPTLGTDNRRLKTLWHLAWPAIIEQVLSTMVSYVDTAMVGSMGANGTAAVSVNGPALWLIGGALMGLGIGYSVQVANAVGAKDNEKAKLVVQQAFIAALVSGLLACSVYEILGGQISTWMGAREEIRQHATNYLRIYAAAYPFMAFQFIFGSILRSMGNSRTPLVVNTCANLMNAVLNFFLIYPTGEVFGITLPRAGLGVEGAALASAISMSLGGIVTTYVCFHQPGFATNMKGAFHMNKPIVKRALQLGLPSAVERMIINVGQIAMTALVSHALSTVALAANSIANVGEGLCYLPAIGVGSASVALIGQSVGANNREDVEAYGHISGVMGVCITLCVSVGIYFACPYLLALFNSDATVVDAAVHALRIMLLAEPLFGAANVYSSNLRGVDDTKFPMIVGLVGMWIVRVPMAFLLVLGLNWGLEGVWTAMACDLATRGILCTLRWYRKGWSKKLGLTG